MKPGLMAVVSLYFNRQFRFYGFAGPFFVETEQNDYIFLHLFKKSCSIFCNIWNMCYFCHSMDL